MTPGASSRKREDRRHDQKRQASKEKRSKSSRSQVESKSSPSRVQVDTRHQKRQVESKSVQDTGSVMQELKIIASNIEERMLVDARQRSVEYFVKNMSEDARDEIHTSSILVSRDVRWCKATVASTILVDQAVEMMVQAI